MVKRKEATPEDAATRSRLIDTAGRIFADRGFQSATVREICAEANANVAAVNYHFGDKLGLYRSVLREMAHAARPSILTPLGADTSPENRLRLLIAAMLRSMTDEVKSLRMMRIMGHELAAPTPVLDQVVDEFIIPIQRVLCQTVAQILGAGEGDEITLLSGLSIVGQVMHFAKARPVISRVWPRMKYTDRDIETISIHIAEFTLAALRGLSRDSAQRKDPQHGK